MLRGRGGGATAGGKIRQKLPRMDMYENKWLDPVFSTVTR